MGLLDYFKKAKQSSKAAIVPTIRNDYNQLLTELKKLSPDWNVQRTGIDSELYRSHWELRAYSRDLWRTNPYLIAYGQEMDANVFGARGYTMRMAIKEEKDRVIHTPDEKNALRAYSARRNRVRQWQARKNGGKFEQHSHFSTTRGKARVEVGQSDIYANQLIERAYADFLRKENYSVTGRLTGNESRMLRLRACARDGEHFIRFVRDARYKYGIKIQHINAEWCDYYCNAKAENGNPIRFGIEYDESGAAPVPVAYHFIQASAQQWQSFAPQTFGIMGSTKNRHVRIPAEDIIHYARFTDDCDVTRPVPWATPIMSTARQQAKHTEAAVVGARVGACSKIFFEADLTGPDGTSAGSVDPDMMKNLIMEMHPGGMHGLPPGVRANVVNPNNPNIAFGDFRTQILREICAGLPGAQFSSIGQNYAEINFSAGRLERLTITEQWKLMQQFDIDMAERPILEAWLKMALTVGAIPLPVEKFWKFNAPVFTGRRWEGVDPIKEATAKALNLANKFTSLQRIHDEQGTDLEEILFEIREAQMIMEELGIESATTQGPMAAKPPTEEPEDPEENEQANPEEN